MQHGSLVAIIITSILGFLLGIYDSIGLLILVILYLSAYIANNASSNVMGVVCHMSFVLCSVSLARHALPGFNNLELIATTQTSENALPMALYLNFDKIHIGLAIVLYLYKPIERVPKGLRGVVAIIVSLALVQLLSVPLG